MRKAFFSRLAIVAVVLFLSTGFAFAADNNFTANKVGVGYQGLVVSNFLNGISVRGWIGNSFGLEGSGFYGRVNAQMDVAGSKDELKADVWMIEAKGMYAFINRSYSKFYAGGKIGYGQIGVSDSQIDGTSFYAPGLLVGAEWSFPQLPEIGFNFDVGYTWLIYDNRVNEVPYAYLDLNLSGIMATFGIHYYF